jgi:hypothetical protein
MGMIEVKKTFTRKELLWFGPLFAVFIGMLCWILWHSGVSFNVLVFLAIAATVLILIYYLVPRLQRPFYRGWMFSVMPVGWVVSHLLLILIYYLLLTPIGITMRIVGYDPMKRKLDKDRETYWIPHEPVSDRTQYFKQY